MIQKMKRTIIALGMFLVCSTAYSQNDTFTRNHSDEILRSTIVITVLLIFMWFILSIIGRFMEFRLKNKIIDKGITDHLANSILHTSSKDDRNINIKWFAVLMGAGIGLLLVYYTMPLHIHSLAYMAFSLAFSFLGYYLYLRKEESRQK
jgi:hypothetical protein